MRHGLPLIHCVDDDTRAKLLGMMKERPPEPVWVELDKKLQPFTPGEEDYDRLMRQPPSRSRGKDA